MKNKRSPRDVVETWRAGPPGIGIPSGFLELCRIDSDMADQPITAPLMSFMFIFSDVLALHEQATRMRGAGWLPHPVLPIADLVGPEKEPDKIRSAVDAHIDQHHDTIYATLMERFERYRVEPYACQVGLEAIAAHRAGLYRLIVPAVFPEIERCGRSSLGLSTKKQGKAIIDGLLKKIEALPLSELDAFLTMETIQLISTHVYKSVQSTADVEKYREFPNRHGSQHGLSKYDRSRDGLNAIFLLDFIILACSATSLA